MSASTMWKKRKKKTNPNFLEVQSFTEDLITPTSHALSRILVFRSYITAFKLVAVPPPPLTSLPPQSPQAAVLLSFLQLKLAPAVAVSASHCQGIVSACTCRLLCMRGAEMLPAEMKTFHLKKYYRRTQTIPIG